MSMDYSVDGPVATVAFNRPERKNAMNVMNALTTMKTWKKDNSLTLCFY